MVEFAAIFEPKVVLIEQVKGLISAACENNIRGGVLNKLVSMLEALGYLVSFKVLLAADYGVAQLRERLFVVATKDCIFNFPKPTHSLINEIRLFDNLEKYKTVKDVIGDLPSPRLVGETEIFPNHADVTPNRDRERISGVPEGECLAKQHHLPKTQRMNLTDKDTTKFRRMAWTKPALTLRGGEAFYHPTENRYLTPREYLRIHGFDDNFILYGPIKGRSGSFKSLDQHRLVANAVPPKLAQVIGEEIVRQVLSGRLLKSKSKLQQQDYDATYLLEAIA
jgi:DNA (cytosine-5)-methyltransferase 1